MKITKIKGQSTAEYAIIIALVVAAAVAMQTYVKRGLQGGIKFAVDKAANNTSQYEPYYLESSYNTTAEEYEDTETIAGKGTVNRTLGKKVITRTGYQKMEAPNETGY